MSERTIFYYLGLLKPTVVPPVKTKANTRGWSDVDRVVFLPLSGHRLQQFFPQDHEFQFYLEPKTTKIFVAEGFTSCTVVTSCPETLKSSQENLTF